ncbi:MAG TPA: hypothetical protein VLV48_02580, partial [Thermoanaerobaculia bacterium]|nr:hypothetical protein [Thermoanaerobaculia bacterium]
MHRLTPIVLLAFALSAQGQDSLVETRLLVPLGVPPALDIQQRIAAAPPCAKADDQGCRENITLAAFRVDAWFPYGMHELFPGGAIRLAIESELAPGVPAPRRPPEMTPAHLASIPFQPDLPPELIEGSRHQTGVNHHFSPWIVVLADPRASGSYAWPGGISKSQRGCLHCERPMHLAGKSEGVREIAAAGPWLRIRLDISPDALASMPPALQDLAQRLDAHVRVVPADLTRPSADSYAAFNPPTEGFRMAQMAMLHTREITFSATDLGVRARNAGVALTRVYSSAIAHFGPFGRSFDSPWFARIRELPDGTAELYDGTGRRDTFLRIAGTNEYKAPAGVFLDLRRADAGFVLIGRGESRMFFDAAGRLVRMSDANTTQPDGSDGNSVRFLYDGGGRLIDVVDPVGRAIHISYWSATGNGGYAGLISSVTDSFGRRLGYRYDASGRLVEVSGPEPESAASETPRTRYEWNEGSGAYHERLYRSGQIRLERDGENRIAWEAVYSETEPWAAATILSGGGTWALSASGALREVLDPLGIKTSYEQDGAGRITKIADANGAAQTFAFDAEGRLLASAEPLGETIEYAYTTNAPSRRNQANLASATQHPRPGTPEAGAKVSRKSEWKYDALGRVVEAIASDGSKQIVARDARGNPAAITDASGITTVNVFDDRGLLQSTSDPRSGTTTFAYEANGFLKALTSAAGTTALETDVRGNVVKATDATGKSASFTFNALDQLEVERRGESESRLRYDATGAVTERRTLAGLDDAGQPVWQVGTSVIDEAGRVRESAQDGAITTWSYDAAGNTKSVHAPGSPPTVYTYDSLGHIASLAIGPRVTTYAYDANGESSAVTDALGRTTTFVRDGFGSSVGTLDPSGVKSVDRHDAGGRPVDSRVTKVKPDGSQLLLRWTAREFDGAGR